MAADLWEIMVSLQLQFGLIIEYTIIMMVISMFGFDWLVQLSGGSMARS